MSLLETRQKSVLVPRGGEKHRVPGCRRGAAGRSLGVGWGGGQGAAPGRWPPSQDPAGQESAMQRGQDLQGRARLMGRNVDQTQHLPSHGTFPPSPLGLLLVCGLFRPVHFLFFQLTPSSPPRSVSSLSPHNQPSFSFHPPRPRTHSFPHTPHLPTWRCHLPSRSGRRLTRHLRSSFSLASHL